MKMYTPSALQNLVELFVENGWTDVFHPDYSLGRHRRSVMLTVRRGPMAGTRYMIRTEPMVEVTRIDTSGYRQGEVSSLVAVAGALNYTFTFAH